VGRAAANHHRGDSSVRKKPKLRKLQLNRETLYYLDQTAGATGVGVIIVKTTKIIKETIDRYSEECPFSHSIDPPGCCITIPPCNP
jgi:hypothetical protein